MEMRNKFIYPALLALTLSSCGAYKEYQPIKTIPENLSSTFIANHDATSLAAPDWKEIFNDKHLQLLIDSAVVRNTDLRIAQLRSEQALATLGAARLAYFPTLSVGTEGNVSRYDGMTPKTYNIGINASWEIDIFGRLTAAKRGAAAAAVGAEEEAQAVRTQLIATVANAYYSLLMLD